MRFTARQIASDNDESLNIRMHDKSKTDGATPMSTDQSLYEISNIKERITRQILTAVKESSFDCMIHATAGAKERLSPNGVLVVEIGNEYAYAEAAFGKHELTWLSTSAGDEAVFLLNAAQF